jgi:hypothetical protein
MAFRRWIDKNEFPPAFPWGNIQLGNLAAYAAVRTNLLRHAAGLPAVERLLKVTITGQTNYGMAAVGQGKRTAGSQRIIETVDALPMPAITAFIIAYLFAHP